jgi:hypothetical protein
MMAVLRFAVVVALLGAAPAWAAVRTIKADGTGDHTTLSACVTAASNNDTCKYIDSSTYSNETTASTKTGIIVTAEAGQTPIMDGTNATASYNNNTGNSWTVEKLRFRRYTGAVFNYPNAGDVGTLRDCIFEATNFRAGTTSGASVVDGIFVYGTTGTTFGSLNTHGSGNTVTVTRSVFANSGSFGVWWDGNGTPEVRHVTCYAAATTCIYSRIVRFSIAVNAATGINASNTHERSVAFNNSTANFTGAAKDAPSLTSNPLLVNAAGNNFRLLCGSPALNLATTSTATTDLDGTALPVGGARESGAYERTGADLCASARPIVTGGVVGKSISGGVVQAVFGAPP